VLVLYRHHFVHNTEPADMTIEDNQKLTGCSGASFGDHTVVFTVNVVFVINI